MTRDEVKWRDCTCSLYAGTSSVIYYSTHTGKYNLYVLYNKNLNGLYWSIWEALIDHGQQPMKMHTEVTLLPKVRYATCLAISLWHKSQDKL